MRQIETDLRMRQIFIILESENIWEKSLSKLNKFCLDLLFTTKDGLTLDHEEKMWQKKLDDYNITVNKYKNSFRK